MVTEQNSKIYKLLTSPIMNIFIEIKLRYTSLVGVDIYKTIMNFAVVIEASFIIAKDVLFWELSDFLRKCTWIGSEALKYLYSFSFF